MPSSRSLFGARGRRTLLLSFAGAMLTAACRDDGRTLVTVQYVPLPTRPVPAFGASVLAGQATKSFAIDATALPSPVLEMETPASGFAVVTVALADAVGVIGGGSGAVALRPNATIAVRVEIDSINPLAACSDCLGAKPFVLAAQFQRTAADSIWMVWSAMSGGASITR